MSENLHLVFSKPPETISDEEYNRWYDFHLGEILVVPGLRLRPPLPAGDGEGRVDAVGPPVPVRLRDRGRPARRHARARQGGRLRPDELPELVPARSPSRRSTATRTATRPKPAWPITSTWCSARRPRASDDDEFVAWYREHADENTQVPGFLANWRFRLEPEVIDPTSADGRDPPGRLRGGPRPGHAAREPRCRPGDQRGRLALVVRPDPVDVAGRERDRRPGAGAASAPA